MDIKSFQAGYIKGVLSVANLYEDIQDYCPEHIAKYIRELAKDSEKVAPMDLNGNAPNGQPKERLLRT